MSALRLYEISEKYKFLMDDLFDEETGVVNETALVKLQELKEPLENKCINVVRVFKSLTAECDAIEKERKAMAAREKSLKTQIDWLKGYLLENMEACEVKEIKCPQFVIGLQKSPPAVDIYDENSIPDEYNRVKVERDLSMIKADINRGIEVPGARLIQRNSVRIK